MRVAFSLFLLAIAHTMAVADELPAGKPIEEVIDLAVEARLREVKVAPAPTVDDAAYLRRVTLDLAGRIPTAMELQSYTSSSDPDKKAKLVDRLLGASSFVRHQANEFDAMLSANRPGELRGYLNEALAAGKSWDVVYRELILPNETDPKQKGASSFLRQRISDLDRLTNDVSVLFFGVNVSCAQCHDHPKVEDWKQDHFFGMKSFFSRTYDTGVGIGEREFGIVKFKPNKGAEKQARMMFLTGKTVEHASWREPTNDERKKEQALVEELKKKRQPPPSPQFSARARFVELSLQAGEREWFARSIVNRLWHRYFGLGLVAPIDQMHSENAPSHPELLAWLAKDAIDHGYDLKRLTRGIVLSKAYARSSRWEGENRPKANLFAVASVRPLTPMQFGAALKFAMTDPVSFTANMKPQDLEKRLENIERSGQGLASLFEQPRDDFQISVTEALLFSNGDRIQRELLNEGGDSLLGRLKQLKTPEEIVDTAVKNVLGRAPRAEEIEPLKAFLAKRSARPQDALRQMTWALLTSAEFRFNH